MAIVESVTPIRMEPPMSIGMEVAFAETTAPTKAIMGGAEASHLRSSTSERRPTMGERTDCIRRGPFSERSQYCCQTTTQKCGTRIA